MSKWPKQNYSSMVKFYGPVGENQTQIVLPYPMVLDWEPRTVNKITCHEKVADTMVKIFKNLQSEYGYDRLHELGIDQFGGMLNVRKMRGGSSWSIHSWGAAIDLDADRNQLKWGRDRAQFAKPQYEPMWKIIEAEGLTSLGRARNMDWMHSQAADL